MVAVPFDQHVRQDRNGVLPFDDALEQLQFAQQISLAYDQFHVGDDLGEGAVRFVRWRADPFNDEGDQGIKNYNRKEVLLKTRNRPINPCHSAI